MTAHPSLYNVNMLPMSILKQKISKTAHVYKIAVIIEPNFNVIYRVIDSKNHTIPCPLSAAEMLQSLT